MNYGSKALMRHNKKAAKPGDVVLLSHFSQSSLKGFGVEATQATLTRKQEDGMWFAEINGSEWCVGSGYDFRIASVNPQ